MPNQHVAAPPKPPGEIADEKVKRNAHFLN